MAEHSVPQIPFHTDTGAEEADPPQESAKDDAQNDPHQWHTDSVQQKIHIKWHVDPIFYYVAVVHTVDHQLIKIGDDQLHIVQYHQGQNTQQQPGCKPQIIAVNMFAENQGISPPEINFSHYSTVDIKCNYYKKKYIKKACLSTRPLLSQLAAAAIIIAATAAVITAAQEIAVATAVAQ